MSGPGSSVPLSPAYLPWLRMVAFALVESKEVEIQNVVLYNVSRKVQTWISPYKTQAQGSKCNKKVEDLGTLRIK